MSVVRGLTDLTKKALGKRGRLSKAEKAAITKAANKNNMSPTEFRKAAKVELKTPTAAPATTKKKTYPSLESLGKGKAKPTPTAKDQGSTKGLTRRQKAQRKSLIKRSEEDAKKAKLQREGVVLKGEEPDRIKLTAGGSYVLPSKEQIDPKIRNYSKRRIRELIKTGQAKMVVDKKGKRSIKTTGKFASPQSMVAEEMGLGSRGALPTAEEARALGLTVRKGGGMVKAKGGKFVRSLLSKIKKKGKGKVTYSDLTPLQKQARRDAENKQKAANIKLRKKLAEGRAKEKKAKQQAKISEALRGAKVADRSKKTSQVAKRVLPHVSQVRNKLKGMSAVDLGQKYTGKELKAMEMKLKKAATPNKALLKRIEKARNFRTGMISSAETPSAHEALGLPTKWKKSGGPVIKRKKPGKVGKKKQGYKARKDESIAMRVKKKRTKKQLKASRNESYGKWGKGKGKGKINRSGDAFVAKSYARRKV